MKKNLKISLVLLVFMMSGCMKSSLEQQRQRVGFDVDDTMLFSTPAFQQGFDSGEKAFSEEFWRIVNSSDAKFSIVKRRSNEIIQEHLQKGDKVYVITARKPYGGEALKEFINARYSIPVSHIYFEPDGKVDRIVALKLDAFYGDSDSDISDAQAAGVKAYRIMRASKSSYKNKYNPGTLGEEVIPNSSW